LERKIIALGENPKNPTIVGDLIKKKDNKIKVIKNKLNVLDV
jgi:hypothetical protein